MRLYTQSRFLGNLFLGLAMAIIGLLISPAYAAQPLPWQMNLQAAATDNMAMIHDFNNFLLILVSLISLIVLLLLVYVMFRFNARSNPIPSKTTHNTLIEIIWTVVPVIILLVIAVPSFKLLYFQRVIPQAEMTIKAVGYQWYWGYEYPDHGDFAFDSLMLSDEERGDQPRLLATDTAMVVPVDTTIRVIVTSADVLHAWAVPAFGLKMDAVPGRLNEIWFKANKIGTFYGQCSELCGVRHSFMPIRVEVVAKQDFADWVQAAQQEYAALDALKGKLAVAQMRPKLNAIE